MTELGLIFGLTAAGLAVAAVLSRSTLARPVDLAEVRRLSEAVARASETFLGRELRLVGAHVLVLGGLLLVGQLYLSVAPPVEEPRRASWVLSGLLLGAAMGASVAYVAAQMTLRTAARTLGAARISTQHATAVALRGSGAVGLLADLASTLGVAVTFAFPFLLDGGPALEAAALQAALERAVAVAPGFGLGSVAAALVLQLGGSAYHVSSDVGGDVAGERDAGLEHGDPRNPAMVADLVGDHVGLAAARSVDVFVAATLGNIAALILAVSVLRANEVDTRAALALVALPLVVRSVGLIASAFGIMSARMDDGQTPAVGLWRGQVTTLLIVVAGLVGAAMWLLGDPGWVPFAVAGTVSALATAAVAHASQYRVHRHLSPLKSILDAARSGEAFAVARGLGLGLQAVWVPSLGIGTGLATAWWLGDRSGLAQGSLLAMSAVLAGTLAPAAYMLSVGLLGPITDAARGMAATGAGRLPTDARRRALLLDDAGFTAATVAQTFFIVAGSVAAILGALSVRLLSPGANAEAAADSLSLFNAPVLLSGLLGGALVLAYAGRAMAGSAQGARAVASEVERQLRGFPRESGLARIPADFIPRYRTLVDLSARLALSRLLPAVIAGLLLPAALGFGLRLLYSSGRLATEGLTAFVLIASVTGLGAALAADGARAVLGAARRVHRHRGGAVESRAPNLHASATGDAVADFLGNSAAPAAHLLAKATVVTALVVAPLLT